LNISFPLSDFNFLYENDSTLILLNENFEKSDSELNYSLRLVK
jgi:hypothetical protein